MKECQIFIYFSLLFKSDISASELDNGSDSNYVETDSKQYAEYDVSDRTGTSLENKETYENDLGFFASLEINAPDEVAGDESSPFSIIIRYFL
jgi:hypothetical protein